MNLDLPEVIFLTGEARGHFVCRHLGLTRVHAELIELVHSKNKKHLDLDSKPHFTPNYPSVPGEIE